MCVRTGNVSRPPDRGFAEVEQREALRQNSFWADKQPCWAIRGCIPQARHLCRAYQDQSQPCWEQQDTLCKELFGLETCFVCDVFKRYAPVPK